MRTSLPKPHEDRLLRLLARYYALRNDQLYRRLYAGRSLKYMRDVTAALVKAGYLLRDTQPKKLPFGRNPDYFRLSTNAIQYLAETGMDIEVPTRGSDPPPGYLFLDHLFSLNDFFLALELLAERVPGIRIDDFRHERELKAAPDTVIVDDEEVRYHADGWISITVGEHTHCLALELDRGTEEQKRWREKVRAMLAWADGPYLQRYSDKSLTVAVDVTSARHGDTSPEARATRMHDLLHWTELELRAVHQEDLGGLFRFSDQDPGSIDPGALAGAPIWLEPFTRTTDALLAGLERPRP